MTREIWAAALLWGLWLQPGAAQDTPPPEAPSGRAAPAVVTAERFMVVAANPLASDADAAALARGGSAVDAMVATQPVLSRNGPMELEADTEATALEAPLVARGQKIQVKPLNSGLHALLIRSGQLESGIDPRREGAARGG